MLGRRLWIFAMLGCADPTAACLEAAKARDHEKAVQLCTPLEAHEPQRRLAWAHYRLGNYAAALKVIEGLAGTPAEGNALRLKGKILERRGDLPGALGAYQAAVAAHAAAKDAKGLARDHQAIAGVHTREARYGAALKSLDAAGEAGAADARFMAYVGLARGDVAYELGDLRAAQRAWRSASEGPPGVQMLGAIKLGLAHRHQGRPGLARGFVERALALATKADNVPVMQAAHLNLALLDQDEGDYAAAGPRLDALERLLARKPDARKRVSLLYNRGRLSRRAGALKAAEAHLRAAAAAKPVPEMAWRIHSELGEVLEARGEDPRAAFQAAIEVVEESRRALKAPALRQWFLEAKRRPFEALFEVHANAGRVEAALALLGRAQARGFADAFIEAAGSGDSATRAEALRLVVEGVSGSPVLAGGAPPVPTMAYFAARGRVWRVTTWPELAITRLEVDTATLAKEVEALLADLDDQARAARLADWLLPPKLPPVLHVVPGAGLGRLPFEILRREGPVVRDTVIAYVPAMGAVAPLWAAEPSAGPALVIGDPLGDLPAARQELAAVGARLGVSPRMGPAATLDALRGGGGLIHLATHAGVGATGAWLQVAGARIGPDEVLRWRLRPRLIVLASCASGASARGGLWGSMGAAFVAAGAQSVLATLWSVDDATTAEFVRAFYAEGGAERPAHALAKVKRAWLQKPVKTWAPYVVFGVAR